MSPAIFCQVSPSNDASATYVPPPFVLTRR